MDTTAVGKLGADGRAPLHAAWKAGGIKTQKEFFARAGIAANTGNDFIWGAEGRRIGNAILLCEKYNLTLDYIYRGDPSGLRYDALARMSNIDKQRVAAVRRAMGYTLAGADRLPTPDQNHFE